jgi:hypothetical protein
MCKGSPTVHPHVLCVVVLKFTAFAVSGALGCAETMLMSPEDLRPHIFVLQNLKLSLFGGGFEYLHRNPASRRRRRKGNPVPVSYKWATLFWGI